MPDETEGTAKKESHVHIAERVSHAVTKLALKNESLKPILADEASQLIHIDCERGAT